VAEEAVYSLNKTSTRDFILKKAKSFGFEGEVLAEMRVSLSAFQV
jgi:predicted RNA methylase